MSELFKAVNKVCVLLSLYTTFQLSLAVIYAHTLSKALLAS